MDVHAHWKRHLFFSVVTVFCLAFLSYTSLAQTPTVTLTPTTSPSSSSPTPTPTPDAASKQLEQLKNQIQDLQNKLIDLQRQERTLSSQIAVMDNQIRLTELRINATKQEVADLSKDIDTATEKIKNLEASLSDLTKILLNRIVVTYQIGSIEPFQMLLAASSVSDFFVRANYLRIVQAHDKRLIYETQQAKNDYANQKAIFEEKKKRVEALKKQLEGYIAQLDQDKKSKQALLDVTKNDEKRYQELLSKAQAEAAAIAGVVATIQLKDGTPIKEGQTIAVVGNSGAPYCSTGTHLHFEIRRNGTTEDPSNYLKADVPFEYSYSQDRYDYYGVVNPHGSWNWPLSDGIKVNQGYGSHGFARSFYPDGFHHGIDMEDDSNLIKSPKDGTLYKGSTSCRGATMNYAAVDHGDGVISWYWHVQ